MASAPIRVGTEVERFIFHREPGNFDLPVHVTAAGGGKATVTNPSGEGLPAVFLLHSTGSHGVVTSLGALGPGKVVPRSR